MATTTDRDTISDRDTIYFLSQELAKAHLRIAQLEADLGAKPNPPEPTPPVPFTGDWVEMGHTAIDASDIAAKASNKSEWEWAVGDQRTNPSVPELWAHLLDYAQKALNAEDGQAHRRHHSRNEDGLHQRSGVTIAPAHRRGV